MAVKKWPTQACTIPPDNDVHDIERPHSSSNNAGNKQHYPYWHRYAPIFFVASFEVGMFTCFCLC
jgi:hypothetical protein